VAKLTFDDEFNGDSLDTSKWQYVYDWSPNGYTDPGLSSWLVNPNAPGMPPDANTYSVADGALSITLKSTPPDVPPSLVGNDPFLGGQLTTKHSFSQTYGYFEVRMQTPAVAGASSAFWALPESGAQTPEIDTPEIEGSSPDATACSLHSGPSGGTPLLWDYGGPNTSAGYNVFAVDWSPSTVTFYLNGRQEFQEPTPADYGQPMYLLLDVLEGAPQSWSGSPDGRPVNAALRVDYVRAYDSDPYVNGVTNPDWNDHGIAASIFPPVGGARADEAAVLRFESTFSPGAAAVSAVLFDGIQVGADLQTLGGVAASGGDPTAPTQASVGDLTAFLQDYARAGPAIVNGAGIPGGPKIALPPDFATAVVRDSINAIQAGDASLDQAYGAAVATFFNAEQAAIVAPLVPA